MVKSMTGYGRGQETIGEQTAFVEIRSVNNRYFDFSVRLPKIYGFLEDPLKRLARSAISRGKTEISVAVQSAPGLKKAVSVDAEAALGYLNSLREANAGLGLMDDLSLSDLIRFPEIFQPVKMEEPEEEQITSLVLSAAKPALRDFLAMREAEGKRLKTDMKTHLQAVQEMVDQVEAAYPEVLAHYQERLRARLQEILEEREVDQTRLLMEASIMAERTAIDEETVRMKSHIAQFSELLDTDGPVGRKLDFLVQEMNREVNTMGSKVQELSITRLIVEIKSEIEKIREQLQNVE